MDFSALLTRNSQQVDFAKLDLSYPRKRVSRGHDAAAQVGAVSDVPAGSNEYQPIF
jgi:hypothetical protein